MVDFEENGKKSVLIIGACVFFAILLIFFSQLSTGDIAFSTLQNFTVSDLVDVNITEPVADDSLLIYNSTSDTWENGELNVTSFQLWEVNPFNSSEVVLKEPRSVNLTAHDLYVNDIFASANTLYLGDAQIGGEGGNVNVSTGNVFANAYVGNGSNLTGVCRPDGTTFDGDICIATVNETNLSDLGFIRNGDDANLSSLNISHDLYSDDLFINTSQGGYHRISSGNNLMVDEGFLGLEESLNFFNPLNATAGNVIFSFIEGDKFIRTFQSGLPFSASFMGNSQVISRYDSSETNGTLLSSCQYTADKYNETLRVGCNSEVDGADLVVENDVQMFGQLFADEGANLRQNFLFVGMGGDSFDVINSSIHVFNTYLEELDANGTQTILSDQFLNGDLTEWFKVNQTGSDTNNWQVLSNAVTPTFCTSEPCARSRGGNSVADRIMQVNVNTSIYENIYIDTWFGFQAPSAVSGYFELLGFNGTNWESLYVRNNFTLADIPAYNEVFTLNTSYGGQDNISFIIKFRDAGTSSRSYVSSFEVFGDLINNSIINVTRYDSKFLAGNGDGTAFMLYNDSAKQWQFSPNNVSFQEVQEVSLNITTSITLNGSTIFSWEDLNFSKKGDGDYLYNDSTTIYFNNTQLENNFLSNGDDANLSDLNVSGSFIGDVNWTYLQNYPSACSAGEFVRSVGDSLTCAIPDNGTGIWTDYGDFVSPTGSDRGVVINKEIGNISENTLLLYSNTQGNFNVLRGQARALGGAGNFLKLFSIRTYNNNSGSQEDVVRLDMGRGADRQSGFYDLVLANGETNTSFFNMFRSYGGGGSNFFNIFNLNGSNADFTIVRNSTLDAYKYDWGMEKHTFHGDIEYSGSLTHISDERMKKNLTKINSAIKKIENITAYKYNPDWKDEWEYGLVAQDVRENFPEAVSYTYPINSSLRDIEWNESDINDSNHYLGVDYIQLVAVLVEISKEQQAQLDELKNSLCVLDPSDPVCTTSSDPWWKFW